MHDILIALIIGIVAGTIDAIPMLIQKLKKEATLSAFTHYLVLGLIIPFVNWNIDPWLKGIIISEVSAIPVLIMISPQGKKPFIPIILFAAVLGAGIGISGAIFIG